MSQDWDFSPLKTGVRSGQIGLIGSTSRGHRGSARTHRASLPIIVAPFGCRKGRHGHQRDVSTLEGAVGRMRRSNQEPHPSHRCDVHRCNGDRVRTVDDRDCRSGAHPGSGATRCSRGSVRGSGGLRQWWISVRRTAVTRRQLSAMYIGVCSRNRWLELLHRVSATRHGRLNLSILNSVGTEPIRDRSALRGGGVAGVNTICDVGHSSQVGMRRGRHDSGGTVHFLSRCRLGPRLRWLLINSRC
ncbi:MAG: hypothetical protein JWR11_2375 [Mycobacterium sp.]|jgi:hypothetical protein|nr:hypothetical protein [Mycobacterium sp.]MDT5175999.1 hypothetical protein [Mycobacterium sp.]